jgi:glycosyltransferase involved in cell wall biosynthesis
VTVALDASYSLGRSLSGVGLYCSRLIQSLAIAAPDFRFLLCYRPNRFFRALLASRPAPNARRRLLEEPLNVLLPHRATLFHGLNQRLPRYRFRRTLTTFHDLFVMTGQFSTREFRERFAALAQDAAGRSDHIVAVSAYTACQLRSLLNVEPSRISVIHHGVDPIPEFEAAELAAFRQRLDLARPFVLHVGAIQERKNLQRLVQAFESIRHDIDLVLAGSDGYASKDIHRVIEHSPARSRIRLLGYVTRPVLDRLYRSAAVLAFPSLDEGFGIPVLEAMSAGLPVVTSRLGGTAEVAGDAALLIEPTDTSALAEALRRALEDDASRDKLVRRGKARAAEFRWERAAAETLDVYRRLL